MNVTRKYQTFWPRFWAGWIDVLVLLPLGFVDELVEALDLIWVEFTWFWLHLSIGVAYGVVLHGLYGQTLGKRVCGVRVLDVSERPLSMWQAVVRDAPLTLLLVWESIEPAHRILAGLAPYPEAVHPGDFDAIPGFFSSLWFLFELLTMLTNTKRRALHDILAGSVVVRSAQG